MAKMLLAAALAVAMLATSVQGAAPSARNIGSAGVNPWTVLHFNALSIECTLASLEEGGEATARAVLLRGDQALGGAALF